MNWLISSWIRALKMALCVVLAPTIAVSQPANAPNTLEKIAGLDVAVWLPPSASGPFPLVLFSHGFGGCKTQSSYLMRAIAQQGILVAAPDHKDNRCDKELSPLPQTFTTASSWSDSTYVDRGNDLQTLRAALLSHPTFTSSIDSTRIALVGHSLGGYTVLALAGARTAWKMSEITPAVVLAPYTESFSDRGYAREHLGPSAFRSW